MSIDQPISDILRSSDIDKIVIPFFQRPYSWTKFQIDQFTSDFENAFENPGLKHFLGLVVFVKNDKDDKIIDIIDGQQRLSTIIILLSVLRDAMEDLHQNSKWDEDDSQRNSDEISKIKSLLRSKSSTVKLITENEIIYENDFIEIIQKAILDFKDKTVCPRLEYENQSAGNKNRFDVKSKYLLEFGDKRITKAKPAYKNYIELNHFVMSQVSSLKSNGEKFEKLILMSNTIIDNFRIIPFNVDSYERAFEYFEVLNDRGLDISALDLIKNECLKSQKTNDEREKMFNAWSSVFSETIEQSMNSIQFIRYAYMSEFSHISSKEIYSEYKKLFKSKNHRELHDYLTKKLLVKAKIFRDFNLKETLTETSFHNVIQLLKSTKTVQWYSIAMSVLNPLYQNKHLTLDTKKSMIKILEKVHEIMFSLNFANVVANSIEKFLPEVASEITFENEKQFNESIVSATLKLEAFMNKEGLNFQSVDISQAKEWTNTFSKNNNLGSMFVFLFKYYDRKSSDDRYYVGSLEHTFPQNPTEGNWPGINDSTKEELEDFKYSFGNFYLTNSIENASLGNKSFKEKKNSYIENSLYDILPIESDLNYSKVTNWDYNLVKRRELYIQQKFTEKFK
jgi:uncharacterized protein with ParB-like and HNH nuclease domain